VHVVASPEQRPEELDLILRRGATGDSQRRCSLGREQRRLPSINRRRAVIAPEADEIAQAAVLRLELRDPPGKVLRPIADRRRRIR
jgi:hypothetical protein